MFHLTQDPHVDHDILGGVCLQGAHVGPLVLPGHLPDDQHPVVVSLPDDRVTRVPAEGQVSHSQQVQAGVVGPGNRPRNNPLLRKVFSFNKTTFNPHFQRIQTINNISLFRTFSDGKVCWSQKIYLNRLRLRTGNSFTKLKSAALCFHIWHLICIQQLKTAFQPSIFFIHREEGCIYSFSSCKSSMNLQVE